MCYGLTEFDLIQFNFPITRSRQLYETSSGDLATTGRPGYPERVGRPQMAMQTTYGQPLRSTEALPFIELKEVLSDLALNTVLFDRLGAFCTLCARTARVDTNAYVTHQYTGEGDVESRMLAAHQHRTDIHMRCRTSSPRP